MSFFKKVAWSELTRRPWGWWRLCRSTWRSSCRWRSCSPPERLGSSSSRVRWGLPSRNNSLSITFRPKKSSTRSAFFPANGLPLTFNWRSQIFPSLSDPVNSFQRQRRRRRRRCPRQRQRQRKRDDKWYSGPKKILGMADTNYVMTWFAKTEHSVPRFLFCWELDWAFQLLKSRKFCQELKSVVPKMGNLDSFVSF